MNEKKTSEQQFCECWWEKSEDNGQASLSWQEEVMRTQLLSTHIVDWKASQNALGWKATTEEDDVGFFSCHPRA